MEDTPTERNSAEIKQAQREVHAVDVDMTGIRHTLIFVDEAGNGTKVSILRSRLKSPFCISGFNLYTQCMHAVIPSSVLEPFDRLQALKGRT